MLWTPVFTGETNTVRFFHTFPLAKGGNQPLIKDNFTSMRSFKNLAGIHDSIGIQKRFDLFHQIEAFPVLFLHKFLLSNPNAMLSGRCSTASQREIDNFLLCLSNLLPLCLFFRNPHDLHMEVAASRMASS